MNLPNSQTHNHPLQNITEELITKLITYKKQGIRLINKFTIQSIMQYFDHVKIEYLSKTFQQNKRTLDLQEYIKLILPSIHHQTEETIYLISAIIDLYKELKITKNKNQNISFLDFTNYYCQKIVENGTNLKLNFKILPSQRLESPDVSKVRQIDINAPVLYEKVQLPIPKIVQDKKITDKKAHPSGPISQVHYSYQLTSIITLDTLSPILKLFSPQNLSLKYVLSPSIKNTKQLAILSFAYSKKNKRIGLIIKDLGISFFEAGDNFSTQKTILKYPGEKIYYLELFDEWITTDKGKLFFWDIKEEQVKYVLQNKQQRSINTLCEIPFLRIIAVAYQKNHDDKYVVLYKQKNQISRLQLGHTGCHTLHYNKAAQVLIPIGYKVVIQVYYIHPEYFDFTLVTELVGHNSLVTCITDIEQTTLICTGDDTGWIRVWDLRTGRCIQILHAARNIFHLLSIPSNKLLFSDSRVNLLNFETLPGSLLQHSEKLVPVGSFADVTQNKFYVCTRKDFRVFNLDTGRLLNIYQIVISDQIITFNAINRIRFVVSTQRGQIKIINDKGDHINQISLSSGSEVNVVQIDLENNLIIHNKDWDINILKYNISETIVKEFPKLVKNSSQKPIRTIKNTHFKKQITIMQVNFFHSILATATNSNQNNIYVWDYEYGKLLCEIKIKSEPTSICICESGYMFVGATNGCIYKFQLNRQYLKFNPKLTKTLLKKYKTEQYASKIISEVNQNEQNIIVCSQKGNITTYSITKNKFQQSISLKSNFNPYRNCIQYFDVEYKKNQFQKIEIEQQLDQISHNQKFFTKIWQKSIHKENITSINVFQCNQKYLSVCYNDGYIKIIKLKDGESTSILNINISLPYKWDLKFDRTETLKSKMIFTLKLINSLSKKHEHKTFVDANIIHINSFLQKLNLLISEQKINSKNCIKGKEQLQDDQFQKQPSSRIKTFNDYYSSWDIKSNYHKINHPTLKQLQTYKRVYLNQSNLKITNTVQKAQLTLINNHKLESKIEERQQIANLLSPNYLPKLTNQGLEEKVCENKNSTISRYLKNLSSILDNKQNLPLESSVVQSKKSAISRYKNSTIFQHAKLKNYLRSNDENSNLNDILNNLNKKIKNSKSVWRINSILNSKNNESALLQKVKTNL